MKRWLAASVVAAILGSPLLAFSAMVSRHADEPAATAANAHSCCRRAPAQPKPDCCTIQKSAVDPLAATAATERPLDLIAAAWHARIAAPIVRPGAAPVAHSVERAASIVIQNRSLRL